MATKRKRISKRAGRRLHDDSRDWANLHDNLLQDVLEKLPLPDCFALAGVCKPWNSVATSYMGGCDREIPCFVKRRHNELIVRKSNNVLENSNFEMELPEPAYGKFIFGSFKDWLFLTRREKSRLDISLLNPFSGENIMLPSTSAIDYLMILSAAPTENNCTCLMVEDIVISFWTPGANQWHKTQLRSHVLDGLFYEGCFYLLYRFNEIVVINEKDVVSLLNNESGDNVPYQTLSVNLPGYPESNLCRRYLVESCGQIVLVTRFFFENDVNLYETYAFETYKLDLHKMAWLKLENLENQILFVGSCCSRSFSTKDLGDAFAEKVYFINDACCVSHNQFSIKSWHGRYYQDSDDWGNFCSQKPNHWPSAFRAKVKRWAGVWLTAPISWCLKQRRC